MILNNDVILDLETTGVKPGCKVLTIGAYCLNGAEFYTRISLASQLQLGLMDDLETLQWWGKQEKAARDEAFNKSTHKVASVLADFSDWYAAQNATAIWGNGSDFDQPILAAVYEAAGMQVPWKYHEIRCLRTLQACFPDVPKPAFIGTKHHALHDARNEAAHLLAISAYLLEKGAI